MGLMPTTLAQPAASAADDRRAGRVLVEGLSCSQGRVIDMSAQGCTLIRMTRWKPGESRRLSFPVLAGRTMVIAGRCVAAKRMGLFKHACDVEFLDLTDDHREALRHIAISNAKRAWCGLKT